MNCVVHSVEAGARTDVDLGGTAVERGDSVGPQPVANFAMGPSPNFQP